MEEQFEKKISEIIENNILPNVEKWETQKICPLWLVKELGEAGIIYNCVHTEYSFRNKIILAESLGRINSLGIACTIINNINIPLFMLKYFGSDQLKEKYLEPMLKGEMVGAIAITEPNGGSDIINSVNTSIFSEGDKLIINGTKKFILNVPGADFVIVLAKSSEKSHFLGFTLVLVPLSGEGITVSRIKTGGLYTANMGEITFDNCHVPAENIIGDSNRGLLILNEAFNEERLIGSLLLLSSTENAIKMTFEFVNSRQLMNDRLGNLQAIRHKLADLCAEYEILKAFAYEVCEEWPNKSTKFTRKVAMLKVLCAENSQKIIDSCLQLFGGRGYLAETPITRVYRDTIGAGLFAGAPEVMKEIISKGL